MRCTFGLQGCCLDAVNRRNQLFSGCSDVCWVTMALVSSKRGTGLNSWPLIDTFPPLVFLRFRFACACRAAAQLMDIEPQPSLTLGPGGGGGGGAEGVRAAAAALRIGSITGAAAAALPHLPHPGFAHGHGHGPPTVSRLASVTANMRLPGALGAAGGVGLGAAGGPGAGAVGGAVGAGGGPNARALLGGGTVYHGQLRGPVVNLGFG